MDDFDIEEPTPEKGKAEAIPEDFDEFLELEAGSEPSSKTAPRKAGETKPAIDEPDFTDIDLDAELAGIDGTAPAGKDEEIAFSDELVIPDVEEMEAVPEAKTEDDLFADFDEKPAVPDRDKKLSKQEDIDALFAGVAEEGAPKADDDITVDLDSLDIEFEEPVPAEAHELEPAQEGQDDIVFFDEDGNAQKKPAQKEAAEDSFDIDTLDILEEPEAVAPARVEKKKVADEDITIDMDTLDIEIEDAIPAEPAGGPVKKSAKAVEEPLFDDFEPEAVEAAPSGKKAEPEDDLSLDLDALDIDLESPDSGGDALPAEDDIEIDMDSLDFDVDEKESSAERPAKAAKEPAADDDITLDMDMLDIDIEEPVSESVKSLPEKKAQVETDDSITLDIDSLDIELDEPVFDEKPAVDVPLPEDDFEIDMDSLDFDLEEPAPAQKDKKKVRDIMREQGDEDEEDIKLNLDELDIDIEEIGAKDTELIPKQVAKPGKRKAIIEEAPEGEDESITIDLDSLDIEVAENAAVVQDEISEEDEKLTLDDAGMTFDELAAPEKKAPEPEFEDEYEEDIKLTLDEVDPEMRLEHIGEVAPADEPLLPDTLDEFPEIELGEFEAEPVMPAAAVEFHEGRGKPEIEPELFDLELEPEPAVTSRYSDGICEDSGGESVFTSRGSTGFSIDFSLRYSRLGALLRLLQLYTISMLPHFVVMLLYTTVSGIVGFINQIVVLTTGRCIEDFAQLTENTLRYWLYIQTCITGIVEDRPQYAGRERIDHQMQLTVTYPLKYSKIFAALRLSMIGMFVIMLPHIVMLLFITCLVPLVYIAGIICVIITGRWPNVLFQFLTMYFRYMARISAFMSGVTDEYPPFRFE